MPQVRLTIDGQPHEAAAGERLLTLLQGLGLAPPALCHDPRLPPAPRCRLCEVEIEGQDRPLPSCSLVASEGLVVRTDSPALRAYRDQWLQALAGHCTEQDLVQHPDKALHQALRRAGIVPDGSRLPALEPDRSHPLIQVDLSRCISCQRCIRVCHELQGQDVWHQVGRAAALQLQPDSGGRLIDSHCVACGACVEACPTAALTDGGGLRPLAAQRWTRTVCPYCGVGCELELGTDAGGHIVAARPRLDALVNRGHLCVKGRYGHGYNDAPQRVLDPMIRRDGRWQVVSWDEALATCADRLQGLLERHGPGALGVLGSARATNEDNYLTQKFARVVLGTNNVDCCARVCHAPTAAAMKALLGTGASTNSYDDIERSQLFLIAGANPSECHPVIGARIKQQLRRGAAQAIVIDPRRTELAALATLHLAPEPGTDIPLFNALAHCILAEDLHDADYAQRRLDGLDAFRAALQPWTPEFAADICGVDAALIRAAARLFARSKPAMCIHGLGLTEHVQGSETVMALVNLALLCGQIGRPGGGVNPLRGQNNVQGSAHMGCEPGSLPGGVTLAAGRARCEAAWGRPLPAQRGLDLMEMLDAASSGALNGLVVVGYDLALSLPDSQRSWAALQALDFLVVQDLVLNPTAARFAHVFLPAASAAEKDGTFMNAERRVQRVRAARPPRGQARPDWRVLCDLAAALGQGEGFQFDDPEAIWNEVRQVWPAGAGISYARLEQHGLQWPCRDAADPGSALLHAETFACGTRAQLRPIEYRPSSEVCSPDYPWMLISGRNLYAFNAATMSGASAVAALRPTDTLDLGPEDAARLGVRDGDPLRVISRHGRAQLPARIDPRLRSGHLFATFHDAAVQLNALTSPLRDALVHAPEYKRTAVRIDRI